MCNYDFGLNRGRDFGERSVGGGATETKGSGARYSENLGESKESNEQVHDFECDRNHLVWL